MRLRPSPAGLRVNWQLCSTHDPADADDNGAYLSTADHAESPNCDATVNILVAPVSVETASHHVPIKMPILLLTLRSPLQTCRRRTVVVDQLLLIPSLRLKPLAGIWIYQDLNMKAPSLPKADGTQFFDDLPWTIMILSRHQRTCLCLSR